MENEATKEQPQGVTYDGGVTEAQVAKWKAVHKKVYRVDVVDGEDLHVGYFHRPTLQTMSAVTKVAKTDEVKSAEVLYDNCWLGGSDDMRTDAILFLAATTQLGKVMSGAMGSLKNL